MLAALTGIAFGDRQPRGGSECGVGESLGGGEEGHSCRLGYKEDVFALDGGSRGRGTSAARDFYDVGSLNARLATEHGSQGPTGQEACFFLFIFFSSDLLRSRSLQVALRDCQPFEV